MDGQPVYAPDVIDFVEASCKKTPLQSIDTGGRYTSLAMWAATVRHYQHLSKGK